MSESDHDVKGGTRRYDASGRRAAASRTRRSILEAAIRLFVRDGYGATTLQAIAQEAGVSVQTIYATLKNKRTILTEALDVAISGDDAPIAVNERDWMQLVWHGDSGEERLAAYARAVARIMVGAGDMFMVVGAAALVDPELVELEQETQRRRRVGAELVVASVAEVAALAPGLTTEKAADLLWVLNGPPLFDQLVRRAGWTVEEYAEWLGGSMVRELLGG